MHALKTKFALLLIACSAVLIFSCSRNRDEAPPAPLNPTSDFSLRDTLKVSSWYQIQDPQLFNQYNGKVYSVNSTNRTHLHIFESSTNPAMPLNETDLNILFIDSSVANLYPSFYILLPKTTFNNLQPEYNLADAARVKMETGQRFADGSFARNLAQPVLSGTLRLRYDATRKAVSGEVFNLRMPIEYYTPETISFVNRSTNGGAISSGGSTRTVQLRFSEIKVN